MSGVMNILDEMGPEIARVTRRLYDEYRKVGFTKEEAFKLIQNVRFK